MVSVCVAAVRPIGVGFNEVITGAAGGVGATALQFTAIANASTDPSPVARSYPVPALNPLSTPTLPAPVEQLGLPPLHGTAIVPVVTSWKTAPDCPARLYSRGFGFPLRLPVY